MRAVPTGAAAPCTVPCGRRLIGELGNLIAPAACLERRESDQYQAGALAQVSNPKHDHPEI
ncbi:MAG TPA: hypothetical protein VKP30_31745 [Polyangiaceae bacterium]|nr:hypothetical protein [Polyangiaceae bacterium]